MLRRIRHIYRDERGVSFVFVGVGFLAFLSATTLAIDVGMFMTGRSQAQNSADAGALAGATALVFDSFTDRSPNGPAVQSALSAARANSVILRQVSVAAPDVTFPNDPAGQPNRVKVNVFRTGARGNAVPTLMGQLFGVATVDILATATAEASPADSASCVLPFTIPDRWTENSDGKGKPDGSWDPSKTFDEWFTKGANQNGGVALPNPDVYVPPGQAGATGFDPMVHPEDIGLELILKANNQNKVSPSIYNPFDIGTSSGGDDYRNNIDTCNTTIIKPGQFLTPENGDMTGPTKQGVDDLIAKDPDAQWDNGCNCVMRNGQKVMTSPRIGTIPLYDPNVYANGQQSGKSNPQLQVTNLLAFFIERVDGGGNVTGRIVPGIGLKSGNNNTTGGFLRVIRLVQ
jgi:Flp pilus assembly protein TadG